MVGWDIDGGVGVGCGSETLFGESVFPVRGFVVPEGSLVGSCGFPESVGVPGVVSGKGVTGRLINVSEPFCNCCRNFM